MIVIDSSVLVMYFAREPGWKKAREVILQGPITLDLAVKEVANALWKKARRGEISIEDAITIVEDLARGDAVLLEPQQPYIVEAFRIAFETGITVYDALFIALARKRGLVLATADVKQAEVAQRLGVRVELVGQD